MISGHGQKILSYSLWCVAAAAIVLGAATARAAETAGPWTVGQLMQALSSVEKSRARFVERKYLQVLSSPLESSGTLSYVAPGQLEKRTLKPKPEVWIVRGEQLTIETGGRRRELGLSDYPVLQAFVESLRGTLGGDIATLERFYKVELEGNQARWQLYLAPLDRKMNRVISLIRIAGNGARLNLVEVQEVKGDRVVMKIYGEAS
ncbi:MAG: LolA-related protein [Burkholderiales bacterium]